MVKLTVKRPNAKINLIECDQPGEPLALNRMIESIPSRNIVIGLNDDVFPTMGALATLYASMLDNPELGAIGVPPLPLGLKTRRSWKRFVTNTADSIMHPPRNRATIIGRMFAFRPNIIGSFPDLISEDLYLMYASLLHTEGFGQLCDGKSYVYYRMPGKFRDIMRQYIIYYLGSSQFSKNYPDYLGMLPEREQSNLTKNQRIYRLLFKDREYTLAQKITGRILARAALKIAKRIDRCNPPLTSKRPRILSSI